MSRLPARTGADVHLADAFEGSGCPLCADVARANDAYLESILSESVNDVGFRGVLDAGRGFCATHARAVLDADRRRSGTLGAAILLRATLLVRLRELERAAGAAGRNRARQIAAAGVLPACPACSRQERHEAGVLDGLASLVADPAWANAVGAAPFCLDHLVRLLARRPVAGSWGEIEEHQLGRLRELRDLLERFAHASSHDRSHLQTDEQRASVDAVADLLAGDGGGRSR
jgi:hypothetical protein